jgi:spermidine synthase
MRLSDLGSRVANITNHGRARADCLVEGPATLRLGRPLLALFLSTVFLNAALLFIIEPMVAKMILPFAGGSPAVWNTSLLFFQASLLLGYLYAHFVSSWLGTSRHAIFHLIFLLAGVVFLPVAIPVDWFTGQNANPATTVLAVLVCSIGFPFVVLSAGAPLLQKWFAEAGHSTARDPYFMYAASNLGSMVGLVAYPFFFERRLTLAQQAEFWLFGYLVLLLGIAACILRSVGFSERSKGDSQAYDPRALHESLNSSIVGSITMTRRVRWLCLSFVPSSLLLGVTSYITTDIVSAPLFWVLPLTIYLLTYVLAFSGERWATHTFVVRRQAFLLLGSALTVFVQATTPVGIILPLHLLTFFATALLCHGQLAKDRPAPNRLTEFYLWISVGGVLGGLFNTIVAPLLFSSVLEYPLAMLAATFLRPYVGAQSDTRGSRWSDGLLPVGLFVAILLLIAVAAITRTSPPNAQLLIYATSGVVCLSFAYRPIRFGLGLGAILLGSLIAPHPIGKTLYAARSFFGVYRAIDDHEVGRHVLFHGTTVHGAQNLKSSLQPIGYYHRSGPAGQVLRATAQSQPNANVAIVGLGTGALACHGSPGQKFTFFEIDPVVEKIARDEKLFTYLRDCPPKTEVVIGDARLSLVKAPSDFYDVVVLDAFSSDVIPSHLLTLEAMKLYLAKTAADGIVLIHISNRYLDLVPVLDRLAQNLNLVAFLRNDFKVTAEEQTEGKSVSRWIAMSRRREALAMLLDQDWQPLDGRSGGDLWTDDFTDVLKVMYWR